MEVAIITGSAGLIGSEAVRFFSREGFRVIGIDNNLRGVLLGADASTAWNRCRLEQSIPGYTHYQTDIRDRTAVEAIFAKYTSDIRIVIHAAAQPSHDWAAKDPSTDFSVNAGGSLIVLESTRQFAPKASFIFVSTNKVYGERPNLLPRVEQETRWELEDRHRYFEFGIDESMSVDQTMHSVFGASKLAADALVQEYGRYFGMNTVCFRGGCLAGPDQSGTMLHGFLSYLMKCALTGEHYTIFGYKGKQVRDLLHAFDLVRMFWFYHSKPRPGEVYNAGGGRRSNCSILEAIPLCEELAGKKVDIGYVDEPRRGDHIWYLSDTRKFQSHYPEWNCRYDLTGIFAGVHQGLVTRLYGLKSHESARM